MPQEQVLAKCDSCGRVYRITKPPIGTRATCTLCEKGVMVPVDDDADADPHAQDQA